MKLRNNKHSHPTRSSAGRRTGAQGFTLIETSIALVILMVTGLGAISLFMFSMNYGGGAADRALAFAIAQRHMEDIRNTPFASLPANGSTTVAEPVATGDPRTFNVTTTVANDPDANVTAGSQKIITITVTPQNNGRWSSGPVRLLAYRASNVRGVN